MSQAAASAIAWWIFGGFAVVALVFVVVGALKVRGIARPLTVRVGAYADLPLFLAIARTQERLEASRDTLSQVALLATRAQIALAQIQAGFAILALTVAFVRARFGAGWKVVKWLRGLLAPAPTPRKTPGS